MSRYDWDKAHPDRVRAIKRESAKRRYYANVERSRAIARFRARLWNARHPEQHRAQVKANKEKRRRADPERLKMSARIDASLRRARKRSVSTTRVDFDAICRRDKMRCYLCCRKVSLPQLEFDHVIPLAAGGRHHEDNIAVTHASCNNRKGAKTLTLF
jgi:5-methylcytosine-specific restriction endonuclease McrA